MRTLVDAYLRLRRAAGFKLKDTEGRLLSFARFAALQGDTRIRAETAIAWAGGARSPYERHIRLADLALFARHVRTEDLAHELPAADVYASRRIKRLPHIYSPEEIRLILDGVGRLGPPGSSRGETLQTLFGLLASTGLRISEALALRLSDLENDGIVVRNTKFRKSRRVPLHETTLQALRRYCARWRAKAAVDDPIFVCTKGTPLRYHPVSVAFLKVVRALGIRSKSTVRAAGSRSPRLHDFRHTFAVRALEACPQGRAAINRHMLALTTYLGHCRVADTFWYLHATPLLMTDIADACELFTSGDRP